MLYVAGKVPMNLCTGQRTFSEGHENLLVSLLNFYLPIISVLHFLHRLWNALDGVQQKSELRVIWKLVIHIAMQLLIYGQGHIGGVHQISYKVVCSVFDSCSHDMFVTVSVFSSLLQYFEYRMYLTGCWRGWRCPVALLCDSLNKLITYELFTFRLILR